jgi:hypothetical protein
LQLSAVSARVGQNFLIPGNTSIVLPYGENVEYDRLQEFNPASHVFTAKRAGEYQVCASAFIDGLVLFELNIYKNGSRYKAIATSASRLSATGCGTVPLAVGDYMDIQAYVESPTAHTFYATPHWSYLSIHRLQ